MKFRPRSLNFEWNISDGVAYAGNDFIPSYFAGSGDAQTLCVTDDDNVWAWGDGDYGKLGRGGSDGCKVPMKVESLAGLGE